MAKKKKYWDIYQELALEQVKDFSPDLNFPELPVELLGILYNMPFGSNRPDDLRVVCAADELKNYEDIIALYKHKGTIQIYAKSACIGREWISVARDEWHVELHVLDTDYVKPLFEFPEPSLKQQAYIRSLGYEKTMPATSEEVKTLIAQLKG
jgi:hypothetical protein